VCVKTKRGQFSCPRRRFIEPSSVATTNRSRYHAIAMPLRNRVCVAARLADHDARTAQSVSIAITVVVMIGTYLHVHLSSGRCARHERRRNGER
jgi:hypothetical protein